MLRGRQGVPAGAAAGVLEGLAAADGEVAALARNVAAELGWQSPAHPARGEPVPAAGQGQGGAHNRYGRARALARAKLALAPRHGHGPAASSAAFQSSLWSATSRDWAEVQEPLLRPWYDRVLDRAGVGPGSQVLDVGCLLSNGPAVIAIRASCAERVQQAVLEAIQPFKLASGGYRLENTFRVRFARRRESVL